MNPPSQKQIRTVALASLLGATIEWYDFFLYGVVAGIVFNKLYFPTLHRDPAGVQHLCHRLPGPPLRRFRLRPLR